MTSTNQIPVTVFTGFLGAGKTTILLSLLAQVPSDYKVCVLKNEFGDVKVDSQLLANGSEASASKDSFKVTEMLNGCLCCVLVGQMKNALLDIKEKYNPDRIIIETSGSAFPAPIAWQIRQLEPDGFILDAIITVIDCVNFTGYEDTSYTAKMQAKYTDVILLNKHELVTERQLDIVIDHISDLNEDTPKLKCNGTNGVSPSLLFGIDTKLFELSADGSVPTVSMMGEITGPENHHANEVDLVQIMYPAPLTSSCEDHECRDHRHHSHESDTASSISLPSKFTKESLESFLAPLPKDYFYRIKGSIRVDSNLYIINWAFGRYTLTSVPDTDPTLVYRITVMGVDLKGWVQRLAVGFGFVKEEVEVLKETGVVKFTAAGQ
ncbi:cobW-domain-containing protein [Rhizoclosmatium globosum]|uniref:CobW-domain-containing protein n=1 Tax=Rhizoclosmatium globosum TaxID=329046 RepID=A0A1Y2B7A9_9FUNG|nr:cobW-domain-containing protein [Rhizoclosmatium globosum]|eukprot:ORY30733.1 cobW-domain-containing protein [Rhizoclosmatium globosum]